MKTNNSKLFHDLPIDPSILKNLETIGFKEMTAIQSQAMPELLNGRDLMGIAQTGTGKTAAFCLPLIEHLLSCPMKKRGGRPRSLVLAPTRELAIQIHQSFMDFSKGLKLKDALIIGGRNSKEQVRSLEKGVDFCVATPGRLNDLLYHGQIVLDQVEVLILDEADRMLDMGFYEDVHQIIDEIPRERQTSLFSATMPESIQELAEEILLKPILVNVSPAPVPVDKILQYLYRVDQNNKSHLLYFLSRKFKMKKTIVFVSTKKSADRVAKVLGQYPLKAESLHGDKSTAMRLKTLANFKNNKFSFLITTDLASRGIDILDVDHVINFDVPLNPEDYVHRIGRTARAQNEGVAVTFCSQQEAKKLHDIEELIEVKIKKVSKHPFPLDASHSGYTVDEAKRMIVPEQKTKSNKKKVEKKRKR